MMLTAGEQELIDLTRELLASIGAGDWQTYEKLCDESITCFEPEGRGHLVAGLDFHRYYFELPASKSPRQTTICDPHVRIIGDAAVVCYVRLVQHLDASGAPATSRYEETRIWQRRDGKWRHIHFHRSPGV